MKIDLLTIEEARKLPKEILGCKAPANFTGQKNGDGSCNWWLRSPGPNVIDATCVFGEDGNEIVEDGDVIVFVRNVWFKLGVRPALRISDISDLERDEEGNILYGKLSDGTDIKWIDISDYLGEPTLLMMECLPEARRFDNRSNNYEISEIKQYLERLETETFAVKIYTHDEAAKILELFEDVLSEYDISVPSPEDDEREEDNMVGLYGSTYSNLLDSVEERLIELLEKNGKIIPYEFSGNA